MPTSTIVLTLILILLLLLPACAGSNPFNTMPPAIARQLPTLTPKLPTSSGEQKATTTSSLTPNSSPQASQTATSEPLPASVAPSAAQSCSDWANWVVDVTLPDGSMVHPGEKMQKIWRIKNSGACIWNQEYSWRHIEGEQMTDSAEIYPFSDEVHPGEEVNIILNFIVPRLKGHYKGVWQLYNPSQKSVGREMWLELEVPLTATEVPSPTLTKSLPTSSSDSRAQQVTYRGVSFTYTRSLAKIATGTIIPPSGHPQASSGTAGEWGDASFGDELMPEAFYFTFDYEEPPQYFSPYIRQLFIYPADDYKALSPQASQRLERLHQFTITATHTLPAEILDLSSPAAQRFATQLQPRPLQRVVFVAPLRYSASCSLRLSVTARRVRCASPFTMAKASATLAPTRPHIDKIINGAFFYTCKETHPRRPILHLLLLPHQRAHPPQHPQSQPQLRQRKQNLPHIPRQNHSRTRKAAPRGTPTRFEIA